MPEMRYVYSSHIMAIGYDPDTQEFHVKFGPTPKHPGGRTAVYEDVPPDIAEAIHKAPSTGEAVHRELKGGGFSFRYA